MVKTILVFAGVGVTLVLSVPFELFALISYPFGGMRWGKWFFNKVGHWWARTVLWMTGSKVSVEGLEKIPRTGGICFVGNHPSETDILVSLSVLPRPFGFAAKAELKRTPILGPWVWLLGGIFIDRKSPRRAGEAIKTGARSIAEGGAMLIYPEGTRSPETGLLPFRAGAFKLATLADSLIIPVATVGSRDIFEASGRVRAARVRVRIGDPLDTRALSIEERHNLSDRVRAELLSLLHSMEAGG